MGSARFLHFKVADKRVEVMKIYKFLNLFIISLVIWLALTFPFKLSELYMGLGVSLIVSLLLFTSIKGKVDVLNPMRWLGTLIYIPVFTWELIKANFHIAYIVLHPKLPVKPSIVKVRTKLKGDLSRTLLANSITLTPGTLTVDTDGGDLYIHCVTADHKNKEFASSIAKPFESHIKRISE